MYFVALHAPDQLRLCVLSRTDSTEEPSPVTLKIDLEEVSKSLAARVDPESENTHPAHNSIGEGSKLTNGCEPALQGDEELVALERIQVEGTDLSDALEQLAPKELTVFVLEEDGNSHVVVGSPDQDFPGLNREAFSAHAEKNASKGGYVLVPLAVVGDTVIVVAAAAVVVLYLLFCVFALGSCIAVK